ncbi:hypothetical protein [Bartonella pachyuromydis]|uniref:Transmembrane protein n=1 Tax=Bartonella pachyuromydis TaxID=931097 RepID=A0ABP8VJC8_9HYPH
MRVHVGGGAYGCVCVAGMPMAGICRSHWYWFLLLVLGRLLLVLVDAAFGGSSWSGL